MRKATVKLLTAVTFRWDQRLVAFSAKGARFVQSWGNAQVCWMPNTSAEDVFHRPPVESRFQRWPGATTETLRRCPRVLYEITPLALNTYHISDREPIPAGDPDRDDWKPASRD